jgi:phosphoenolpyruvate carboxylase
MGGDRDGNPNVTAKVSSKIKSLQKNLATIIFNYFLQNSKD